MSGLPIESAISDQEASLLALEFKIGIDNLWVPEHGWNQDDGEISKPPRLPQYLSSLRIMGKFFGKSQKVWIHLAAEMQAGKTGVLSTLIRLILILHNFKKIKINQNNIFVITGMNDKAWIKQTCERLPKDVRDNVYHSKTLVQCQKTLIRRCNGGELKNVLIVIDESHFAAGSLNLPSKQIFDTIRQNCPIEKWAENNVRLLTISATDPASILVAGSMKEKADIVRHPTSEKYQSIEKLLLSNRIHNSWDFVNEDSVKGLVDIVKTVYPKPLYHIIRPKASRLKLVEDSLKKFMPECMVISWDSKSNSERETDSESSSSQDINDILLKNRPDVPTFILLKNMFYAAKTLDDKYVGILYDREGSKDDTNLQSLVGRACGYGKSHRTIIFTSMSTVDNYLKYWRDLGPQDVIVPDEDPNKFKGKMSGINATPTNEGVHIHTSTGRATPMGDASQFIPGPTNPTSTRGNNQDCIVEYKRFDSMDELNTFWKEMSNKRKFSEPNKKDDQYICSLGKTSEVQIASVVERFCARKDAANWGSGITNAKPGEYVGRVYVGYEGDKPIFFLRWTVVV